MNDAETIAANQFRGHHIAQVAGDWLFTDTGLPVAATWQDRPCGHCNLPNTPEGHDGCLGTIPGVMNACCGHGVQADAYIQYADGSRISGLQVKAILDATPAKHERKNDD